MVEFYVCKKNRWFSSTIINVGLKQHVNIADSVLYAKFYKTRAEAESALKILREKDPLYMYKGYRSIKKYCIKECEENEI